MEGAGEEVHTGRGNEEQPGDLEDGGTKIHHGVVFHHPALPRSLYQYPAHYNERMEQPRDLEHGGAKGRHRVVLDHPAVCPCRYVCVQRDGSKSMQRL
jgi:hypothetical protein